MKILLYALLALCMNVMAQPLSPLVEFSLSQSPVIYQLNKVDGSLFAIIRDVPGGICVHKMSFKNKVGSDIYVYERTDLDIGKQYYQRLEVNLISDEVNIFTSIRNRSSIIPISKRDCKSGSCTNINALPQCNY